MPNTIKIQLYYFLIISIIGFIITTYDKIAAKKLPRHRVPESGLMFFGIIGGALVMYITMRLIHHKTRKSKFAKGFPIIIIIHIILLAVLNYFLFSDKITLLFH